ncbi:MAG: exonuclease SbcCD subunit D [Prevotella sp.]|jgi:exonuclease SbcD|nr:exonuclease SbcCD subunit D [Prevotella sp.]MCH4100877.1 exonuclease SbcCD subunit D [Prevotella sp.]MCI1325126.1 exonuclease SbcCD subunit D [Prevotella sp.]MCI1350050.1 exonuclease SbcCD subunit D [Prevotella sp.]MCI2088544.1 exonuclease SbcCD subunit D [Prevotella sp.]
MKILHTSDWHLGHNLYNYDRTEEQTAMIRQMTDIVKQERPDVFLLSGDVYHTPQPSAAVQTLFSEAMVKLHDAYPEMVIVVTAGNHDSGSKHDIFRTPWHALKVYTVGNIDKEHPETHIVEIPGKGYVIAIPYGYERNIPEGFFQELIDRVTAKNSDNLPIIMMAHTTVKGCDFTGHDNATEFSVGGIDSFDIDKLGKGYDYLALGHIHHAQFVHGGDHRIRYSGTPLAISFDEAFDHTVSIVEIPKHGDTPDIKTIPITNPHPLTTLPTKGFARWEEAKTLLKDFPDDIPAYIRLNVEVDDVLPAEANAEANELVKGKKCRFCHINVQRKQQQSAASKTFTVQEFQEENPLDIAHRYADDMGIPFDDEMESLFKKTVDLIHQDDREI